MNEQPDGAADGVREHRRFALRDVTLSGSPVGGATIDVWRDAQGVPRWSARLLIPIALTADEGMLRGVAADGRQWCGLARVGDRRAGPRRGREVLAELHGTGTLDEEPGSDAEVTRPAPRRTTRAGRGPLSTAPGGNP
jgi:hypothetical protein